MRELTGKSVVVTGAGRGIGEAYARCLADLGAAVVVNDLDAEAACSVVESIREAGGNAIADDGDIGDWDKAGATIQCCIDAFGAIDGLVNNAAWFGMGTLDETDPAEIARFLSANIAGTMHCAAHALPLMRARGRGSIVNITSGAHMGVPAMGLYAATKGAVASLTYCWALELQGSGIRVNCVSPNAHTRMAEIGERYFASHGIADAPHSTIPPEANAGVVAYLMSDASAGVNGQIVRIENRELSLVAHPVVALPLKVRAEGWDFAAVRQAFETTLQSAQLPIGIIGANIAGFAPASTLWAEAEAQKSAS